MEFKNFDEFYNKAYNLAQLAKSKHTNFKQAITFARKAFSKTDLNSFYCIGYLQREYSEMLKARSNIIKLSIDSLIKNLLEHPDLNYDNYRTIPFILKSPDDVILGTCNHLRFFKFINENLYEVIIKNTKNRQENFLLSLHRSDLSKLKNLKIKR